MNSSERGQMRAGSDAVVEQLECAYGFFLFTLEAEPRLESLATVLTVEDLQKAAHFA
jgi:hypothetical protein